MRAGRNSVINKRYYCPFATVSKHRACGLTEPEDWAASAGQRAQEGLPRTSEALASASCLSSAPLHCEPLSLREQSTPTPSENLRNTEQHFLSPLIILVMVVGGKV